MLSFEEDISEIGMCLRPYFLILFFSCNLGEAGGLVTATIGVRNVRVPLFLGFLNPLVFFFLSFGD